jgi:hypothetical protein
MQGKLRRSWKPQAQKKKKKKKKTAEVALYSSSLQQNYCRQKNLRTVQQRQLGLAPLLPRSLLP